ncbi:MAG: hypothetical protein LBF67_02970 [Prevotellaceae bacterium]|nr:hypothetical protein [Prevotellaceae bacterium]
MGKKANISLTAGGELFGFPAELGIARIGGETLITGLLNTKGRQVEDLLQNRELDVSGLAGNLTALPKPDADFSVSFAKKSDKYAFVLTSSGIACGIILAGQSKQLLLALDTEKLKSGNDFERFVATAAEWAGISRLLIIVQNGGGGGDYSLLQKVAGEAFAIVDTPKGYESYQLIAAGVFDLSKTGFGKCVNTLTGLKQLRFAVGGSFASKSFEARLISDKIETSAFVLENFSFGLKKSSSDFSCVAGGNFIFKLENNRIGFSLFGAVSNTSFTLSATSLPNARIPLNSRLSFSDLALSIGVNAGAVSFGMTGRLNTNNLSIFAGFAVSPPRITLFTAALTSTTGRISLKDLVVEIADIQWDAVNCLDVVAVGDFDLTATSLPSGGITKFPTDSNDENYEKAKNEIEQRVVFEFNKKMDSTLQIKGSSQLTPLGNDTNQYILTDKGTMRHYRIDGSGRISLNCQIYVCTQETTFGTDKMPVGFFICGTLEIFKVKARFLFLVNKGKSLVALVQVQKISIGKIFSLGKSNKTLPVEPIHGGLAGQLIKPSNDGAVMYLNIQKDKGELTFYLSAHVTILGIFEFDSLVLIKDRFVYVNIEYTYAGFKIVVNLKGGYKSFSETGFEASVVFDTTGFLEILKKAQETLKNAARSVKAGVEEATRKLNEAQQKVLNLQGQINNLDKRIAQCRSDISRAKWYQLWIKIARAAEIVGLGVAKAGVYVALGVAYSALEVAKAALKLGGAVVSTILESLAYIINAVTQMLWIKSFELGITANPQSQKIRAKLVLTVFGKDVTLDGELNLAGLIDGIKNFVTGSITKQSNKLVDDIKSGKVKRAIEDDDDAIDMLSIAEYSDLTKNNERYAELLTLRDTVDDLFMDANDAYFDAFNEENADSRESACRLTELRWEEEIFQNQHSDAFDDELVESLDTVIKAIRQEKELNRAEISDEIEAKMDGLLHTVKSISNEKESRTKRAAARESLFSRLEKSVDVKRSTRRTRAAEAEVSADEANEKYAESLSKLLELHLGDKTGEVTEDLKRTLGVALYQFRNPDDTFRKQRDNNDNNNEEDEEDFE